VSNTGKQSQKGTIFLQILILEATGITCPIAKQVVPVFLGSNPMIYIGGCTMSKTELTDNLTFASALQMLKRLVAQGLLSADEAILTRRELERKLRPTIFLS
jgi:hypothetical protein